MLFSGILLGSLVFFGVKSRIRQVRKVELEKREKLEVQNRVLQLEQKALQLQMNPHFIFNALNSVQSLMSAGETVAARNELNAFAQLMRSILSNSRKQVVSLQEETETLQKYLTIEQFCRPGKPFDFQIQIPENLDAESIEIPPMLLQPFVENAVVHGFEHLQNRKGQLKISFETEGETLRCIIADNGVGIDMSFGNQIFEIFRRLNNASVFEGTGVGLSIVKRIVEKHKGRIWYESELGVGTVFYISFNK